MAWNVEMLDIRGRAGKVSGDPPQNLVAIGGDVLYCPKPGGKMEIPDYTYYGRNLAIAE
jgi:hypothetical protein